MEKWDFEKIDFEGCLETSEAIEKYLGFKENTPKEFMPCLDWWFFCHIADYISHDLYELYREASKKLVD